MSLRLTPGARSTLPGMSHGCPDWNTNIGAIDQPPKMYPTMSLRSCPGICHTPDAVKRCFRSEKYGPWFLSNETSSTYALPIPVVVLAPSSVHRGTHV